MKPKNLYYLLPSYIVYHSFLFCETRLVASLVCFLHHFGYGILADSYSYMIPSD